MFSEAIQDYLKAIYHLQERDGAVATSALAQALGVAAPSVTGMMKKLAGLKLVRHTPYQGVLLTPAGRKIALEVIRHHRLLELYLAEALGYSWDRVHEEAERLEHVISEEFEEKIFQTLGCPVRDPHGEPIPAKDGQVDARRMDRLSELAIGTSGVIGQVSESTAEILRYLGARGLVPDTRVTVTDTAPFDGPITVRCGNATHILGRELAGHIRIEPAGAGPAAAEDAAAGPAGGRAESPVHAGLDRRDPAELSCHPVHLRPRRAPSTR
jgi:DtxR family transcriptional regulator, Mn-dependent transcriptional regulator